MTSHQNKITLSRSCIRLNIIIKNAAKPILECLASVEQYIDSWVIMDTDSTDGTQAIIQAYIQGILGQVSERPCKILDITELKSCN